jgi:CBS domain-containing protein
MICPACSYDNVAGAATCEGCAQDLTLYETASRLTLMEVSVLEMDLAALRPKPPVTVAPDCSVADAIALLKANHVGCVLVGTEEALLGIFSERDALLRVAHRFDECSQQPIEEFMTPGPESLEIDTPIAYAVNRMALGDFRHLPVTRNGRIEGVISLRDVLAWLARWYPDLLPALPV